MIRSSDANGMRKSNRLWLRCKVPLQKRNSTVGEQGMANKIKDKMVVQDTDEAH